MLKTKIVDLSNTCPEVMTDLERLHYEVMTKERVIGIALGTTNVPSTLVDKYYQDYLATFTAYENAKTSLYTNYIAQENQDGEYATWEADFLNKSVILHG